jgi:hypothetical protein
MVIHLVGSSMELSGQIHVVVTREALRCSLDVPF